MYILWSTNPRKQESKQILTIYKISSHIKIAVKYINEFLLCVWWLLQAQHIELHDTRTVLVSWNLYQIDCKTAVFFANVSDGPYSNERLERLKKRQGRMVKDAGVWGLRASHSKITLTALPALRKQLFCSLCIRGLSFKPLLNSDFCSMGELDVLLIPVPSGWDASSSEIRNWHFARLSEQVISRIHGTFHYYWSAWTILQY